MKPVLKYYDNGQLESEEWRINGDLHRLNGPAYQEWRVDGELLYESWRVNGKSHRLDGPAYRWWNENGQIKIEAWRINGDLHRLNGPAYREWYENGQLRYELWYFKGIEYKKEEHPFILFCKEHSLQETYEEWPNDMKFLFEVIYK